MVGIQSFNAGILVVAEFEDVEPDALYDVLHDPEYRSVWDTHMLAAEDAGHINVNNDVGYYASTYTYSSCISLLFVSGVHSTSGSAIEVTLTIALGEEMTYDNQVKALGVYSVILYPTVK
ncbi:jg5301 [Pararge aegeria aegeria]|uniref:Jg5301 protein n=1 Tax=Pararge aegeria aegeria TaxID=348720 RepID=A0A8S4R731_9NEOP|nr:jg5301 [Pararge aegeria aegeria]